MASIDVVVAGAGAAGCSAALSLHDAGLSVVVVEADQHYSQGCNTANGTGLVTAVGTRWQSDAGVEDSLELFVRDVEQRTMGTADVTLTRSLGAVSATLLEWLESIASVPWEFDSEFVYPGHTVPRCHGVPSRSGSELHGLLLSALEVREIPILVPASLVDVELALPGELEIRVAYPDGADEVIDSRACILATGGYGAASGLVGEFIPSMAGARYQGSAFHRGDAIRLGRSLGAGVRFLDAFQGGRVVTWSGLIDGWCPVAHGGVIVGEDGMRFGNEVVGYSEFAGTMPELAYLILDERVLDSCVGYGEVRANLVADALRVVESIEDISRIVGCETAAIAETLKQCRLYAEGVEPDPFGRLEWGAVPLGMDARLVVTQVAPALFHTQGGLLINGSGRVLGEDGVPTAAPVWAAGGAAMGISGSGCAGYLGGNGLLAALGLGYLAGCDVRREFDDGQH